MTKNFITSSTSSSPRIFKRHGAFDVNLLNSHRKVLIKFYMFGQFVYRLYFYFNSIPFTAWHSMDYSKVDLY